MRKGGDVRRIIPLTIIVSIFAVTYLTFKQPIPLPVGVSIIGVLLALLYHVYQRHVNELNRTLKKPELKISNYGNDPNARVIFSLPFSGARKLFEIPLIFEITNEGGKSIKSLEFYLQLPAILAYGGQAEASLRASLKECKLKKIDEEWFSCLSFTWSEVQPGQRMSLKLPLSLPNATSTSVVVKTLTADNVPIELTLRADYSLIVKGSIFHQDQDSNHFCFPIMILDGQRGAIRKHVMDLKTKRESDYQQLPFFQRIKVGFTAKSTPITCVYLKPDWNSNSTVDALRVLPDDIVLSFGFETVRDIIVLGLDKNPTQPT
jgi:hypothetical protein